MHLLFAWQKFSLRLSDDVNLMQLIDIALLVHYALKREQMLLRNMTSQSERGLQKAFGKQRSGKKRRERKHS